jgi:hypothetical protein
MRFSQRRSTGDGMSPETARTNCCADRSVLRKDPVMMVLDYPGAPAVVLVVEDEMLLRMRAVNMILIFRPTAGFSASRWKPRP